MRIRSALWVPGFLGMLSGGCGGDGSSPANSSRTIGFTLVDSPAGLAGSTDLYISGLSDSGTIAVGTESLNFRPLSWNGAGKVTQLKTRLIPNGISSDGRTIVGQIAGIPASYARGGSETFFPVPAGFTGGTALDMGGNVVVAAGTKSIGSAGSFVATKTAAVALPGLSGGVADASAISADGKIVVGTSEFKPVIWTNVDAPEILALSESPGTAYAVSADGKVVVGRISNGTSFVPFRWTIASGANSLPLASGMQSGEATSASADGSVIIGNQYEIPETLNDSHPFIWTAETGMRLIETIVAFDGPAFAGLTEPHVTAISADGKTIAGYGHFGQVTRSFLITLP